VQTQKVKLIKIKNNIQFEIARKKIDVSLKIQLIKSAKRFMGRLRVRLSRVNQRRYRNHYCNIDAANTNIRSND